MLKKISLVYFLLVVASCGDSSVSKKEILSPAQQTNIKGQNYAIWDKNVRAAGAYLGKDKQTLLPIYGQTYAYDSEKFGQEWIMAMTESAATDMRFSDSVKSLAAKNGSNFIPALLKNPKQIVNILGSDSAFNAALKALAQNDYAYRLQAAKFEASARKQSIPHDVGVRKSAINSIKPYMSVSAGNPSIMERILTIATIKILGKQNTYEADITKLATNMAMTQCFATAKRNSAQCGAAAYDGVDLSFCMARHNIAEPAKCLSFLLPS